MTVDELIAKLSKARDTFRAGELPVFVIGTEWDFEFEDVKFKSATEKGNAYAANGDDQFPDRIILE